MKHSFVDDCQFKFHTELVRSGEGYFKEKIFDKK